MAILDRVLQRGPDNEVEDSRMTILEHLEALRRVLVVSVLGWAACTVVAFLFWQRILEFLIWRGNAHHLYFTGPTGGGGARAQKAPVVGPVPPPPVRVPQIWWVVW